MFGDWFEYCGRLRLGCGRGCPPGSFRCRRYFGADFGHLVANTPPLLVLGTTMLFLYPASTLRVLPAVWLGSDVFVWLFGRESVHYGASGLVYGLASYIFVAGILRRDRRARGSRA